MPLIQRECRIMSISDTLASVRYVTDASGERTDVLLPLSTWEALLEARERLAGTIEDQEDRALLQEWLARRASGEAATVTLQELEQELVTVLAVRK
jgi:hypothetical protein